jgi:hypothetical protein
MVAAASGATAAAHPCVRSWEALWQHRHAAAHADPAGGIGLSGKGPALRRPGPWPCPLARVFPARTPHRAPVMGPPRVTEPGTYGMEDDRLSG